MKKFAAILSAAILAASCAMTQTYTSIRNVPETLEPQLVGLWACDRNEGDTFIHDSYMFNEDGTFTQRGTFRTRSKEDAGVVTIEFKVSGGGYYGVKDGVITFDYLPKYARTDLVGFDIQYYYGTPDDNGKTAADVRTRIINPMKQHFKKYFSSKQTCLLQSVGEDSFTMKDLKTAGASSQTFERR